MEQSSGSASSFRLAFSFCRETETVSENQEETGEGPREERIQDMGISTSVKATPAAPQTLIPVRLLGQIQSDQGGHIDYQACSAA